MKKAQAKCRRLRQKGDPASLQKAAKLEAAFRDHPDYESDQVWITRMQSGGQHTLTTKADTPRSRSATKGN